MICAREPSALVSTLFTQRMTQPTDFPPPDIPLVDMVIISVKHDPTFPMIALFLGTASLVVACLAVIWKLKARSSARILASAAVAGALFTALAGVVGRALVRSDAREVVARAVNLSDAEQVQLVARGDVEAAYILWFCVAVSALPFVIGAAVALTTKPPAPNGPSTR